LLLIGFAPERAQFIEKLMHCAKQTGTPVILEGIGANRLARKFAAGLTGGRAAVIEVPIGVHTSEVTNNAIGSGADVLAFTSANLSCPTGYAQPVLAAVVDKAIEPQSGTGPLSIFSGMMGPMALPWPVELQAVALKLPVDRETAVANHEVAVAALTARVKAALRPASTAIEDEADHPIIVVIG